MVKPNIILYSQFPPNILKRLSLSMSTFVISLKKIRHPVQYFYPVSDYPLIDKTLTELYYDEDQ